MKTTYKHNFKTFIIFFLINLSINAQNTTNQLEKNKGVFNNIQVDKLDNRIETVLIGDQEWTSNNLNVSKYRNGDLIPEVKDKEKWKNLKTGAWCYLSNDKNNNVYGKLYNWYAVSDPRGLAPNGFKIPSDSDWHKLIKYLGGKHSAHPKLTKKYKLIPFVYKEYSLILPNNSSGFSGIMNAGYRLDNGVFGNDEYNCWWTSTSTIYGNNTATAIGTMFTEIEEGTNKFQDQVSPVQFDKSFGFYVRCIKD